MRQADRLGARHALILSSGDRATLRDMEAGRRAGDRSRAARRGNGRCAGMTPPRRDERRDFPALREHLPRHLVWPGAARSSRFRGAVAGWVHRRRDATASVFIDLRDRTGLVQLVFQPEEAGEAFELGPSSARRTMLTAGGPVVRRSPETVNPDLPTGEVEIRVGAAGLISDADTRRSRSSRSRAR